MYLNIAEAGDIFARLFDHRAFVQGEQNSFVTEFEVIVLVYLHCILLSLIT
jgi:hypothetical protein